MLRGWFNKTRFERQLQLKPRLFVSHLFYPVYRSFNLDALALSSGGVTQALLGDCIRKQGLLIRPHSSLQARMVLSRHLQIIIIATYCITCISSKSPHFFFTKPKTGHSAKKRVILLGLASSYCGFIKKS